MDEQLEYMEKILKELKLEKGDAITKLEKIQHNIELMEMHIDDYKHKIKHFSIDF